MEIWEYLGIAPKQVLKTVLRADHIEVIYELAGQRFHDKIAQTELLDAPVIDEPVIDATDGARVLAEEHGVDLGDLHIDRRITQWDVKEAINAVE